ncbi:MAG TPA: hypothetical protein PKC49_00380 [Phycisphaerae bacterium]|nr:hypothetical protein [Phycisphaerae bacterium]
MLRGTSNGALVRTLARMAARLRDPLPALGRIGEEAARIARRRAPRGSGPGRIGAPLAHSISWRIEGREVVLVSDRPHAAIQAFGGAVLPVRARMLAIPVSDAARRLLATLGAARSLREVPGLFVLVTKGRAWLARYTQEASQARGARLRRDRRGRAQAAARIGLDEEGRQVEFLFLLRARTDLPRNPAPSGYVPRIDDDELAPRAREALRRHVLSGGGQP